MEAAEQLRAAVEIAREAGESLVGHFGSRTLVTRAKGNRDIVTEADLESERHVIGRLRDAFPDDGVVGEEGSRLSPAGGGCWYVDPLDGTMNFSRGLPIWCVSIGRVERGHPTLGAIHDPLRGETFAGARGEGVTANGEPARCSQVAHLRNAFIHITVDFESHGMRAGLQDLNTLVPLVMRTRNIGSAALALAYVAAGRLDAMLHRSANAWDYAAGVALVEEAGGVVTDFGGRPYMLETRAVVAAATRELHRSLLETVGHSAR